MAAAVRWIEYADRGNGKRDYVESNAMDTSTGKLFCMQFNMSTGNEPSALAFPRDVRSRDVASVR